MGQVMLEEEDLLRLQRALEAKSIEVECLHAEVELVEGWVREAREGRTKTELVAHAFRELWVAAMIDAVSLRTQLQYAEQIIQGFAEDADEKVALVAELRAEVQGLGEDVRGLAEYVKGAHPEPWAPTDANDRW